MFQLCRHSPERPLVREDCVYFDAPDGLSDRHVELLKWLMAEPFCTVTTTPVLAHSDVVEVGPRLAVETSFSTRAVAICRSMGIPVVRAEKTTRFLVNSRVYPHAPSEGEILRLHLDRMTQEVHPQGISSFSVEVVPHVEEVILVLEEGKEALAKANKKYGWGMDEWDVELWYQLFVRLNRNPTLAVCAQLGNGNSEHSRHWFFGGIQIIDGVQMPVSLLEVIQAPWKQHPDPGSSLAAFNDNSGVFRGTEVELLMPSVPGECSPFVRRRVLLHYTSTAETHNHPTLYEPYQGAATGGTGRMRDNDAVGRGGLTHAGFAGYAFGNLHLPGHRIPGEDVGGEELITQASPHKIFIRGSDGISETGNEIGEPLLGGFVRSFGQMVRRKRREWRKPVLYTAGQGRILDEHVAKLAPEPGMKIIQSGGPAHRIGVGGGAASSMSGGSQSEELDFASVQRVDAWMQNKVWRVIRTCAEMREDNPILSIHDQGAGGPSNVITELMEGVGGEVDIRKIVVADKSMTLWEIWIAEYQERYGLLLSSDPGALEVFQRICAREKVNCEVLGEITGSGRVVVIDSDTDATIVDLPLKDILGELPQKTFTSTRPTEPLDPLVIPSGLTVAKALKDVLLLPQVGSKYCLMHKADRAVTGLVAQQPCCGPLQVPVANVGIKADGYLGFTGAATALGEQPIKMLISPEAGARMTVAEMLLNIASARITDVSEIKCRVNWMVAAKLEHEGAWVWDAATATRDIMLALGIAPDGGKDSLSMATNIQGEQVVAPGELVVAGSAPMLDIRKVVNPDLEGEGELALIDLGLGKNRLGGSSLAQALGCIGNESPDIGNPELLRQAFLLIQELIEKGLLTAYHDKSDGGLITTLTEMCIAGNCGATVSLSGGPDAMTLLFSEEAGAVVEFSPAHRTEVHEIAIRRGVPLVRLGETHRRTRSLTIRQGNTTHLDASVSQLRMWWEHTSWKLEQGRIGSECADSERRENALCAEIPYHLTFTPKAPSVRKGARPKLLVLREEGTNSDREMIAAHEAHGFEVSEAMTMEVLDVPQAHLSRYNMVAFPGGFTYADTMGSAKGWAGPIVFNPHLKDAFDEFFARKNTLSFGVCNGCQLTTHIGLLPWRGIPQAKQPRFTYNRSASFESRWSAVKILPNPPVMLAGMEGSILGVHSDHGEGQLIFPDESIRTEVERKRLVPVVYVGPDGEPTETYPHNPNGSKGGWAGLCSEDGRHLAMMPHPERCFLMHQEHWTPREWRGNEASPWMRMFENARDWCDNH